MQSVRCAFSPLGAGDGPETLCSSGPTQRDAPPTWTQPSAALHRSSLLQQASGVQTRSEPGLSLSYHNTEEQLYAYRLMYQ